MALRLYNTMSSQVEEFIPLRDREVRMYACGPTVYDYGHIGNFRTFIAVDMLRRFLDRLAKAKHVMNITDVDDKIIPNAAREGVSVQQYTKKYRSVSGRCRMIEHRAPQVLVQGHGTTFGDGDVRAKCVEEKGFAYRTEDGSYYFRIAKFPQYGKLSKKDFAGMTDGARVDVDEYDKDSARDFALWKAPKPGEAFLGDGDRPGRPGMAYRVFGDVDEGLRREFRYPPWRRGLHLSASRKRDRAVGGMTGKTFVHCWVHARFLLVEGEKMAKSAGNFYTLRDLC